jgi:hypothetical protein
MCSRSERARKRYADDPVYRQKRITYASTYRKTHKDKINEEARRRWQTDPAHRERRRAAVRKSRQSRRDRLNELRRLRYQTDAAHREKLRAQAKQYRSTRPRAPNDPQYHRSRRLLSVYGLSQEDYDAMLERQGGVCAICKRKPDKGKPLCVDHCHVTGEVRGLLCHKCNSVLAFGNDDPDILRAAIAYLQAALASEASGQRGNFIVRAHSASEDARERADDPRPEPGSSARATRDRDRNVTGRDTAGASGRAMRPPDIVAAVTKPYDSGVT